MQQEGRVLSLITQDPNDDQKFVACPQALAYMLEFEGDFCFVSICGEYRTGKSFLLNVLFPQCARFQTSPTTSSCTRGINIWSRPIVHNRVNVWLVDTEGFGSIQKDAQHDGKLFMLNLLLSNVLIYNSVGAIDEQAIAKLALVTRTASSLERTAPATKLFWVLRDFALEMEDRNGKKISADQYLEDCLRQGHPGQRAEKQFLRSLFKERHCVALVRPLIDEKQLNSLRDVRWESLREQFRGEVRSLQENVLNAVEGKVVKGVKIGSRNFSILLQQFVNAANGGDIDCGLNPTYQRILQFEHNSRKQAIIDALQSKAESVRKIMPVQLEHLSYLQQQLTEIARIQVQDLQANSSKTDMDLLHLQLSVQISKIHGQVVRQNRERVAQEVRQYLYRQLVELCPRLVSLPIHGFQPKFQQAFSKLKDDYCNRYATFLVSQDLHAFYSQFAQKEERKLFLEVTKRWRASKRQLQEKSQELRKAKRTIEEDIKRIKEEKDKAIHMVQLSRREQSRNIQRMKDDVEEVFREQAKAIARGYQSRMQEQTLRWEQEMITLREVADRAQDERVKTRTEAQYQRKSLQEKLNAERERNDLLAAKWQQSRSSLQLQLEQTKNGLENKLRIAELKHADLQNTLNNERKKFQIICEQRKSEEVRLLHQVAQRNHLIDELTQEKVQLQGKYRQELQRILLEEKEILCKTLSAKLNEYDYRCKIYESKLAEASTIASERDFHEKRSEELQLQGRQLRAALEQQQDKTILLSNKVKKLQCELQEKENAISTLKEQHLKEVSLLSQNLQNSKNFLREAENRHKQELQWLKNKQQTSIRQQTVSLTEKHAETVQNLRSQWEQKWQQERCRLMLVIKHTSDESQQLKMSMLTLTAHNDKVATILSQILTQHHSDGRTPNNTNLTDIAESPDQDTERLSSSKRQLLMKQAHFLAEEVEQAFRGIKEQCEYLAKERATIRQQLRTSIEELQSYEQVIGKLKQENKNLRVEVQEGKQKIQQYKRRAEGTGKEASQLRERVEGLQREKIQLRRESELKEQLLSSKDQNHRQNTLIYKETIANITEQNRQLTSKVTKFASNNENLQAQLQRFQIWASQVKSKPNISIPAEDMEMSADKIRDLQGEIKRLARQLQDSRAQRGKEVRLYTPLLQQNRVNQLQTLRVQNDLLLRQLQEKQELQSKWQQERRIGRQRMAQQEQSRYSSVKDEFQVYKKRSRETISALQSKIAIYEQQNRQLRQEFQQLEENLMQKYDFDCKLREKQVEQLKRQRKSINEFYTKKLQNLQETHSIKNNDSDRRVAESELKYEQFRSEMQKEKSRIVLQGERHRLKYEHLLKVNGQLIKEVQSLKSKAHQMTIKEKYKSRISSLFDD